VEKLDEMADHPDGVFVGGPNECDNRYCRFAAPPATPPALFALTGSSVGTYDPTSGAVINAKLIPIGSFGSNGFAVSGSAMFLINGNSIGKYNANFGTVITQLSGPTGLLVASPPPTPVAKDFKGDGRRRRSRQPQQYAIKLRGLEGRY
jgi:hypothetical protein